MLKSPMLLFFGLSLPLLFADHGKVPAAGHSIHSEEFNEGPRQQASILGGTGEIDFDISTQNHEAQQFFNQGMGQLHGFWFFEAERSFRQAAMLDPDCAIHYWGMAMANLNNELRAKKFSEQASQRKDGSTRLEKSLIAAMEKQYANLTKPKKDRRKQFVRDLEDIVLEHPDHLEIKALLIGQTWKNDAYHGIKIASHAGVDALARQVLDAKPLHPIHHYLIHLWDGRKPAQALASAGRCGQSAPHIAHMWHMPSHIYSKLHRYHDAAFHQEASARIDHQYMIDFQVLPNQIHNYVHNSSWLAGTFSQMGRFKEARQIARNLVEIPRQPRFEQSGHGKGAILAEPAWNGAGSSYQAGRKRLIALLIEGEFWSDLIALSTTQYLAPAPSVPMSYSTWDHFMGIARFETGDNEAGNLHLDRLQMRFDMQKEKKKALKTTVKDSKTILKKTKDEAKKKSLSEALKKEKAQLKSVSQKVSTLENGIKELTIYQTQSRKDDAKTIELLKKDKVIPKPRRARLFMQAGDLEEASKLAKEMIQNTRKQVLPLATAIEIAYLNGEHDRVTALLPELARTAQFADDVLPILKRIDEIATKVTEGPALKQEEPPLDFLSRPNLDSLGPRHWAPVAAPLWTLPQINGETLSLADFRGKPVVLIFYLGAECVHCMEQLNTFGPMIEVYRKKGIEVIAVSSDPVESLVKTTLQSEDGFFSFLLVSDAEHETFKDYLAFDNFEDKPLHGTFFIDPQGLIRWQDISFEPFDKPNFLLEEAQRLLAFPQPVKAQSPL